MIDSVIKKQKYCVYKLELTNILKVNFELSKAFESLWKIGAF